MRRQCHRLISLLIPSSLLAFSTSPFSSSPPSHLCTSDTTSYTGWAESKEEAEAEFYSAADWGNIMINENTSSAVFLKVTWMP